MTQVNVNPPPTQERPVETVDTSGDRSTAAGINLVTVVIALVVVVALVWYLLTGPLHGLGSSSSAPSTSGSNGSTQGDSTERMPARKARPSVAAMALP
jgi:hypothetical protein